MADEEKRAMEISIDELCKFLEDVDFEKMVDKAINNPGSLPKNMIMNIDDVNNVVSLVSECCGYDCSCSPAREDCCISEDKVKCVFTVPMKRFNEMIGV